MSKKRNDKFEKNWGMVKYSQDFSIVSWGDLSAFMQDMLAVMIIAVRSTNAGDKLEITFNKLEEVLKKRIRRDRISEQMLCMSKKLHAVTAIVDNEDVFESLVIFPGVRADKQKEVVSFQVNPSFRAYFNEFEHGYIRWDFDEHLKLSTAYAKCLYRQLCSFKDTGEWRVSRDEFVRLMGIPDSYDGMRIVDKVIKPSVLKLQEELPEKFSDLKVGKIKKGRSIVGFAFTFTPFKDDPGQFLYPVEAFSSETDDVPF